MTRSRSILPIATALVVVMLVAACSSGSGSAAPSAAAPTAAAPTAAAPSAAAPSAAASVAAAAKTYKDMTVGFIQTGSEGGWRAANTASFKDEAKKLGINLKFYDAQNKLENQLAAFRQFIADPEVNVIILAALAAAGWDDVLKEAKAKGKTVVIQQSARGRGRGAGGRGSVERRDRGSPGHQRQDHREPSDPDL